VGRFSGATLELRGSLSLGGDADNVRFSPVGPTVLVGYGSGALALIDARREQVIARIALPAHPESFQLTADGKHAFVNVPGVHAIAVVDLQSHAVQSTWATRELGSNFPMALGTDGRELWVAFRSPPRLASFDARSGARTGLIGTCGDSDDLFIDARLRRLYAICGSGSVDVYGLDGAAVRLIARIPTRSGARTGLFVPAWNKLYVAARASGSAGAAIMVFRTANNFAPP
jgi:hypothetical protein